MSRKAHSNSSKYLDSSYSEDLKEIYSERIKSQHEYQSVSDSQEWMLIKSCLNPEAFPILSAYHHIENSENGYFISKHRDSPDNSISIFTFGSQSANKIDYIVQTNGQTTYSYASTKNPGYNGNRVSFEFKADENRYVDGHCIDHGDTPSETLNLYGKLSTEHSANHIPEPWDTYWGLHYRNWLVRNLRKSSLSYSQLVFYSDTPIVTNLGSHVPTGVLFFSHSHEGNLEEGWSIPWDSEIHRRCKDRENFQRMGLREYSLNALSKLKSKRYIFGRNISPKSFSHISGNLSSNFSNALIMPSVLKDPYDYFSLYRMEVLAESEHIPMWSLRTADFLLDCNSISQRSRLFEKLGYWTKRTFNYIEALQSSTIDTGINYKMLMQIWKKVKEKEDFDRNGIIQDQLRQIIIGSKDDATFASMINKTLNSMGLAEERKDIQLPDNSHEPPILTITIGQGKGSINKLKTPLSEENLSGPATLEFKFMVKDKNSPLQKLRTFLNVNKSLLQKNKESIVEVIISGNTQFLTARSKALLSDFFSEKKIHIICSSENPNS
ncbi:unnamed protein product [Blepharisma stoltei]|uniref:Uncharacterized protein n=1 Tax=Blepharisma stoltei TaxID=1481888 RepID=A0AAU9JSB0_9CILI|nr:unnamed protein product [Blepharisma stoltei]